MSHEPSRLRVRLIRLKRPLGDEANYYKRLKERVWTLLIKISPIVTEVFKPAMFIWWLQDQDIIAGLQNPSNYYHTYFRKLIIMML